MNKRLLREAEDDSDDESDPWIAKFNDIAAAAAATGRATLSINTLPPPPKKSKKAKFLDDVEDEYLEDDTNNDINNGMGAATSMLSGVNAMNADKVLASFCSKTSENITREEWNDSVEERYTNKNTSMSQERKSETELDFNIDRDSISMRSGSSLVDDDSSYGRAAICISGEFRPVFHNVEFKREDKTIHLPSPSQHKQVDFFLNHHIVRYLLDHQVEGIQWLWFKYLHGKGAILADDMGMGKTIQITALMSIIFCKTGVGLTDTSKMRLRRQQSPVGSSFSPDKSPVTTYYLKAKPCLITCPKTLVDNWSKEIQHWGYFTLDVLHSKLSEDEIERILERAKECRSEIVLVAYSQIDKFYSRLAAINWNMIVFDEGHKLKNTSIKLYQQISSIKHTLFRLVATGTPIQNDLQELWSILHLIDENTFADRKDFSNEYEKPIKFGMRLNADQETVNDARVASHNLGNILHKYMLGRKKKLLEGILSDDANAEREGEDKQQALLKGKDEVIVLCDLSPIQRDLYEHCLGLPDFDNVRYHASPCPCGSMNIRGKCCPQYRIPYKRDTRGKMVEPPTIDPRAALWSNAHANNEPCGDEKSQRCPLCVLLPCLSILGKISCHPALLQYDATSARTEKQDKIKNFSSKALTPELIERMGGLQRSTRFMDMKSTVMSGKMKTLQAMLEFFARDGERTLVFSLSTQVLDMIEALVKSRGWSSLRLDGQTQSHRRQQMVDQFNSKHDIMIFLISSRAGGLGLNLCSASKVIIFDVDWNPVVDMQSQDRAYRIGQKQHLVVYRLVSKGTIEEMIYMRQLYKQQLHSAVPMWQSSVNPSTGFKRGNFEGVEGEAHMRGELFGIENLLQFSTSSILQSLRAKYSERKVKKKMKDECHQNDLIPRANEMRKDDVTEVINFLMEDLENANGNESDDKVDPSKSSSGLALLHSMGINIKNAHRLDEMLDNEPVDEMDLSGVDLDAPTSSNGKVPRSNKRSHKEKKRKSFEVDYSSGPSVRAQNLAKDIINASLKDLKTSDALVEVDLLELDNSAGSSFSSRKVPSNLRCGVIDLVESDNEIAEENERGRIGNETLKIDEGLEKKRSSNQEGTIENKSISEIFVRRVIKPKRSEQSTRGITKEITTITTQPLMPAVQPRKEEVYDTPPIKEIHRRVIPGISSSASTNSKRPTNATVQYVKLYMPSYK